MDITLCLTNRCNLKCRYCYANSGNCNDMLRKTSQLIVDYGIKESRQNKLPLRFLFFGGEPLLCFDHLMEISRRIRRHESRLPFRPTLSLTTNGLLIDDHVLDYAEEIELDICISLDGDAFVHDQNRVFEDGSGSFSKVIVNACRAANRLGAIKVNAVFGPDTVESLPQTVSFLSTINNVSIYLNPDIKAIWGEEAIGKIQTAYEGVAQTYIDLFKSGRLAGCNLIDSKIILMLKGGYSCGDMCRMGEGEISFAPNGDAFPCERFVGCDNEDNFRMGNIHTGVNIKKRSAVLAERNVKNRECGICTLRNFCMNWCCCTNYHQTGVVNTPHAMLCESEKNGIRAAAYVLKSLQDDTGFCNRFLEYASNKHHFVKEML
jgi:uncharacterized protein